MQTFSATTAKAKLGLILDTAQREPVTIEKQGRPYAVVIPIEAYQILEDYYLILRAEEAKKEESKAVLNKLRKKIDKHNDSEAYRKFFRKI